jgi:hypothetical protein
VLAWLAQPRHHHVLVDLGGEGGGVGLQSIAKRLPCTTPQLSVWMAFPCGFIKIEGVGMHLAPGVLEGKDLEVARLGPVVDHAWRRQHGPQGSQNFFGLCTQTVGSRGQQFLKKVAEVSQGRFLGQVALYRARWQVQDFGVDERQTRMQTCAQRSHPGCIGLVGRIPAILCIAQVGMGENKHGALVERLHRLQAGQQLAGALVQGAAERLDAGPRSVQSLHRCLPGGV